MNGILRSMNYTFAYVILILYDDGWLRTIVYSHSATLYFFHHIIISGLRTNSGAISVQIRLALALRILAGGSYLDVAVMFGLGLPTVYEIFWQVVDAINATPEVGAFNFPQDAAACLGHAERFKVRLMHASLFSYTCKGMLTGTQRVTETGPT